MRLALVANPAASGFTASLFHDVVTVLADRFDVTRVWPEDAADARRAANEAASNGFDVVAAMGGDGVVHQVANGLLGTGASLGIIPAGTTNVLSRLVGLPKKPRAAAAALAEATEPLDLRVAVLDSAGPDGERRDVATFAAGIGFDAEVVRTAERQPFRKVTFGAIHYARTALGLLVRRYRRRLPYLRVESDDRRADGVAVFIQVHNEFTFFGGVPLSISAGSDAWPTAAVAHTLSPLRTMRILTRAATRLELDSIEGVEVWNGFDRMVVEADPPGWYEADGELLGRTSRVEISRAAEPLRILGPTS